MWEINNASQLIAFLTSLAVGCVFCLIYDIFRAIRKSFNRTRYAVFFEDILYSLICGVIGFLFLLAAAGGEIRAFALVGMGVGFFICRFTLSRLFLPILLFIIRVFKTIFRVKFSRLSAAACAKICSVSDKMRVKNQQIFKIHRKYFKKRLEKEVRFVVYLIIY